MTELIAFPNKPKTNDFKVNAPAFNQRDNDTNLFGDGSRQCFLTTISMLIEALKPGTLKKKAKDAGLYEAESAYAKVLDKYGDTTDNQAHVKALKEFGIEAYFSSTASIQDVATSLYNAVPCAAGIGWSTSGHWLLFTGRNDRGLYGNNPYGILHPDGGHGGYYTTEGFTDFFSWSLLKQVYVDLGPDAGYAIFVTSVDGKPTGIKSGL